MQVNIQAWNFQKNQVQGISSFTYENLFAKQGAYFADRIPIILPDPSTYFVIINLNFVEFEDGSRWDNINYVPFRKVKWYKRFLPELVVASIAAVVFFTGIGISSAKAIYGSSFSNIPFHYLRQEMNADQVVNKMGNNYTMMSDGTQNFLNYGTYNLNGNKGNLELYFDSNEELKQMVWDMGYAADTEFSKTDLSRMANYLNETFDAKYKLDDSNTKDIVYTWNAKGISYKLEFQKTSRGNDVTLTGTSDGSKKL